MAKIKALSVKQPWAGMIASGQKTIETRTWETPYRGNLLIVSSKLPRIEPAGCALAIARLVDCRPMTVRDELTACCHVYPDAKAWVLENIRPITPFYVKGSLGLYVVDVPDCLLPLSAKQTGRFDRRQDPREDASRNE